MCLPGPNPALQLARHITAQIARLLFPEEDLNPILKDSGGDPEFSSIIKPVYQIGNSGKTLQVELILENEGNGRWGGSASVVDGKKTRSFIYLPDSGVHEIQSRKNK